MPEFVGKLFFDCAKGLQALHGKTESSRVLHRDIKPQNILIDQKDGQLKAVLADFDLSEFELPQADITMHITARIPVTYDFIAPELLVIKQGRLHTVYSDLYSLGITFGFILTGCAGKVLRTEEEMKQLPELTRDQKELIGGLIRAEPQSRTPLIIVLKNPFIRGYFCCIVCYDMMMVQEPPEFLEKSAGHVVCPLDDCIGGRFSFEYIAEKANAEVMGDYFEIQKRFTEAISRRNEREKLMKQNETTLRHEMEINQQLREAIIEGRQNSRKRMLDYLMTEKAMEYDEYTRRCPSCRRIIQKLGGCSNMRCGVNYHGVDQQDGCGILFDFNNAPRYKSSVRNIDQMIQELSREHLSRRDIE